MNLMPPLSANACALKCLCIGMSLIHRIAHSRADVVIHVAFIPVDTSRQHLPRLLASLSPSPPSPHHTLRSPALHPLNLLSATSLTSPHRIPCAHRTAPSTSAFHLSFHVCVQSCRCTTNLGASSTGTMEGSMIEFRRRDCWCRRRAWSARFRRWVEMVR